MNNVLVKNSDPILHKSTQIVEESEFLDQSSSLKPIAALLIETLYANKALGVSACQVGIDKSIFVMDVDNKLRLCINPAIVAAMAEMKEGQEGCLSYRNLFLSVKRPDGVIVRYKDIDGREVTEQLQGMEARVWLHEYDHTQGICFVDRVSKLKLDMAKKKKEKLERKAKS